MSTTTTTEALKIYKTFIFSAPIFFAFLLLLFFYFFYLRRQRVDWASLRMRTTAPTTFHLTTTDNSSSPAEIGLKKEVREMLPVIVYNQSFSVQDTQCPVCLTEYEAEDRLQQIPKCGHTFHMGCIDLWLAYHSTCPLCRLSLIPPPKSREELRTNQTETSPESSTSGDDGETSTQASSRGCGASQATSPGELRNVDPETPHNISVEEVERTSDCADEVMPLRDRDARN